MSKNFELLIATRNRGKIAELAELLRDVPVVLKSLDDFPSIVEPEETGANFAANAALKALYYARHTDLFAIADDSGLEVDALGGAPGVFSARYAGATATDVERTEKLLGELRNATDRCARFVCAVAVSDPFGKIEFAAEGICEGTIADFPRGANGFGYDPIFVPKGFTETFGELPAATKHEISHRARAVALAGEFLRDFCAR